MGSKGVWGAKGARQRFRRASRVLVRNLQDEQFYKAAKIGVEMAGAMTGADVVATAVLAGVEGYRVGSKEGWKAGVKAAATEAVVSTVAGEIANQAVGSAAAALNVEPPELVSRAIRGALSIVIQETVEIVGEKISKRKR